MTALGLVLTLFFTGMVVFLSRPWAALGLISAVCYVTQGQVIDIGGMNFTLVRIILLAGFLRVLVRGEFRELTLNPIDQSLIVFMTVSTIAYIASRGTSGALVFQLGSCYNVLFSYFLFRCLIRNGQDLQMLLSPLAWLLVPLMVFMVLEAMTGKNVFTIFGGLPDIPVFRSGYYRAQGPFRNAITAGVLGATLMPLFVTHYFQTHQRKVPLVGFIAATVITLACGSSGPLLAYLIGLMALVLWPWRNHLRFFRWSLLLVLISLHFFMKAPVWYLFTRMSDVMGGSGWHRAFLIDQAINHFDSWWLAGTDNTGSWIPYQLEIDGSADITNQFLVAGVRSGVFAIMLLILVFIRCFKNIGLAIQQAEEKSQPGEKLLWGLGCSLVITIVNFLSVAYFDQIEEIFYLQLAVISSVAFHIFEGAQEPLSCAAATVGLNHPNAMEGHLLSGKRDVSVMNRC